MTCEFHSTTKNNYLRIKTMKTHFIYIPLLFLTMLECNAQQKQLKADVFETSTTNNKLNKISNFSTNKKSNIIQLLPDQKFQTILGF